MYPQWREHYAKVGEREVHGREGVQGETDGLAREEGRGGGYAARQTDRPGRTGQGGFPREPAPGDRDGPEGGGGFEGGSVTGAPGGPKSRPWIGSSSTPMSCSRRPSVGRHLTGGA